MPNKLKRVGFLVPMLDTRKVPTLNRDTLPRIQGRTRMRRNAEYLARFPWCRACERKGIETLAREVDHVVPIADGGTEDESNLQGLCIPCHREKSANESRGRNLPGLA